MRLYSQTGYYVRCGQFAPLRALSYAKRFGRTGTYIRKQDVAYCQGCAEILETSRERIQKAKELTARRRRLGLDSRHYNDSRDHWGMKILRIPDCPRFIEPYHCAVLHLEQITADGILAGKCLGQYCPYFSGWKKETSNP